MTIHADLCVIFAICYLLECLVVVDGRPALFMRLILWRVFRTPGIELPGGKRLLFINPVPFLAEWQTAPQLLFSPTGKGPVPVTSLNGFLPAERADKNRGDVEERYRKNLIDCGLLAGMDNGWDGRGLVPDKILECWTDPALLASRRGSIKAQTFFLKILCTAQLVFASAFFFFLLSGDTRFFVLAPCLAGIYVLGLAVAVVFFLACRKVTGKSGPAVKAVWMFFYPPAAMRAVQSLSAALHVKKHETAVALALFGEGENARCYLAGVLSQLRFKTFERSLGADLSGEMEKFNALLSSAVLRHWHMADPLEGKRIKADPGAVCYCPVCGNSMSRKVEFCPNCVEVRAILF